MREGLGYAFRMIDRQAQIAFNKRLTADTWLMGLHCEEMVRSAKPGQFAMIRVREGTDPLLRRPFSICGTRDDLVLVLYRVVGRGTEIMSSLEDRGMVALLGPLGRGFGDGGGGSTPLLVAGGIGIAPLLFLAQCLPAGSFRFLAGFRSESEIIPVEEIVGRPVDMEVSTDDGSQGHQGPVTDLLQPPLEGREKPFVYACGPRPMLRKVAEMTLQRGVRCEVSLEASMACGVAACQGCAVKASPAEGRAYYHVCKDGPVFQAGGIDWDNL